MKHISKCIKKNMEEIEENNVIPINSKKEEKEKEKRREKIKKIIEYADKLNW
jgi:vacuolar-type H+-ATPase subunit F/Vma7